MKIPAEILAKAAKIKLLLLDVDGVMTTGQLYYSANGEELKVFHVHDGLGIKLLQQSGVAVGIISSRNSAAVTKRAQDLNIKYVYQGQTDKRLAFKEIIENLKVTPEQVAYVGDDLIDLPLIKAVGFGIAVANAQSVVKQEAAWQTCNKGGKGAVREVCELIMQAQGTLDAYYDKYN